MTDPMEPLKKLMAAFSQEIEPLGLHVHTFALLPNPDGPPHSIQAMLLFDGQELEAVSGSPEDMLRDGELTLDERDAFEMLARDMERSTQRETADDIAARLKKMQDDLESGADILDLGDDE